MHQHFPKSYRYLVLQLVVGTLFLALFAIFQERSALVRFITLGVLALIVYQIVFALIRSCSVTLDEDALIVDYLLPLRMRRTIPYAEITGYSVWTPPSGRPCVGILTTNEGEFRIWLFGVSRPRELHSVLEGVFGTAVSNQRAEATPLEPSENREPRSQSFARRGAPHA